jgi:hypothetical protein
MMVSFVGAHQRVRSTADAACIRAEQKYLAYGIVLSDGTLAAATTTSSDFGRHRFMDSFKVANCHLMVER